MLRGCIFNPAPVMKLVEVVSGLATAAEVVEQLCELTLSWGKAASALSFDPGFIVNRVARRHYSEGRRALEEQVAAPEVIDAALRDGAGFPMGPLELTDLIGQDVNFAVTCSVFNAFWQGVVFTFAGATGTGDWWTVGQEKVGWACTTGARGT